MKYYEVTRIYKNNVVKKVTINDRYPDIVEVICCINKTAHLKEGNK